MNNSVMDTPHSNYGKSRLIYPALADVVNTRLVGVMKAVNKDLVCLMKDFGSGDREFPTRRALPLGRGRVLFAPFSFLSLSISVSFPPSLYLSQSHFLSLPPSLSLPHPGSERKGEGKGERGEAVVKGGGCS